MSYNNAIIYVREDDKKHTLLWQIHHTKSHDIHGEGRAHRANLHQNYWCNRITASTAQVRPDWQMLPGGQNKRPACAADSSLKLESCVFHPVFVCVSERETKRWTDLSTYVSLKDLGICVCVDCGLVEVVLRRGCSRLQMALHMLWYQFFCAAVQTHERYDTSSARCYIFPAPYKISSIMAWMDSFVSSERWHVLI